MEELWTKYQVPPRLARDWIEADRVLPLLDGLDEVAEQARAACVQAIITFYQSRLLENGSSPLVACCRSEEYNALSTRILAQRAVSILPLSEEQIDSYLEQAGEEVGGLRQVVQEDCELHALARYPLMLTIFTLAYRGATPAEISTGETREATQKAVFVHYVERMLHRRKPLNRWKREQAIHWLAILARQMHRHNQTIFLVESLQPDALPGMPSVLYRLSIGLAFGLAFGLALEPVFGLAFMLGSAFGIALVFGLRAVSHDWFDDIKPTEALIWSWENVRSKWRLGLLVLVDGASCRVQYEEELIFPSACWGKVLRLLGAKFFAAGIEDSLQRLKAAAETAYRNQRKRT